MAAMVSTSITTYRQCNTWRAAVPKWPFLNTDMSVMIQAVLISPQPPPGERPCVFLVLQFKADQVGRRCDSTCSHRASRGSNSILHLSMRGRGPLLDWCLWEGKRNKQMFHWPRSSWCGICPRWPAPKWPTAIVQNSLLFTCKTLDHKAISCRPSSWTFTEKGAHKIKNHP